jgi:ArsR family transcriptional regulator
LPTCATSRYVQEEGAKQPLAASIAMEKDPLSAAQCADRLKALADKDRLRIVQALRGGPKNVGQLATELGTEMTNVSHHLQILKREEIVETEKQGRFVVYRLHPDVIGGKRSGADCLDFGCCKLELPK